MKSKMRRRRIARIVGYPLRALDGRILGVSILDDGRVLSFSVLSVGILTVGVLDVGYGDIGNVGYGDLHVQQTGTGEAQEVR